MNDGEVHVEVRTPVTLVSTLNFVLVLSVTECAERNVKVDFKLKKIVNCSILA